MWNTSLEQIVYDRGFDFSEILKNEPVKRPDGDITLAILMEPSFGRSYKLYIIKNDESYFIVGQLKVNLAGEQQFQHVKKIIAYSTDPNRKSVPDILEINDPWYNVEWHFEITESFYNNIFDNLAKIYIPIKSSESGLDGTSRSIYLNQTYPIHIEWWQYKETQWNELTDFTDDLFSFAITKFNKTY